MIEVPHAHLVIGIRIRLRAFLVRIAFRLGSAMPTRPEVVLATAHAGRITGNLAWIRDELTRRNRSIRIIEIASQPRGGLAAEIAVALGSLVAGYRLATARLVVVDDYYFPMYVIRPRPGTTRVQVWHASGAFKRFGYSVLEKSFGVDERFVRRFPIHTNYDLCLVSSMHVAPFYAEAFHQPMERFTSRLGIPRTDLFFDPARVEASSRAIRDRYAIPAGKRTILFAPTFRGDRIIEARSPQELDVGEMQRTLGADHVLLVRDHPFVRNRVDAGARAPGFAIDVSDHPDINELMLVSDVLVTDYSSAMYEFSLLGRPIAFFAPDHDAYERERGFYLDYRTDLPGPIFERTEALAEHLRAGAFDLDRVRRFRDASFDVADGHASERFVDEVVLPALR